MYRHWPNPMALLRDTLARTEVPRPAPTGDLRRDLVAHLDALRDALDRGHLGYVVSLLGERSRLDPEFERLRAELTDLGCEPLERLLRTAIREGRLPADVDLPAALAELEGPVFYRCMIHRERLRSADVVGLADRFLTSPPLRKRRAQPFPPP